MKHLFLLISLWGGLNYLSLSQKVTSDSSKVPKIDSLASPLNNLASNTNNYIPSIIPPSPNAASLGKFVETPVGLYNGIPEVSIPIYNVSLAGNNLPISISYHAGGVKVSDIASNVGLGWSLNAGGVISKTIVGLPDGANGNTGLFPFGAGCTTNTNDGYVLCLSTAVERTNDTEPDIFNYNFNGYSGKFVFNRSGQIVTMPYSNIKFVPTGGTGNFITAFTATTEDGTMYSFTRYESTLYDPSNGISTNNTPPYFTPSSWYLTEITYPNTNDKITLEYYDNSVDYWTPISESYSIIGVQAQSGCPVNVPFPDQIPFCEQFSSSHNTVITRSPQNYSILNAATLKKITFPNGIVEFVEDGYRKEVRGYKSLEKIRILDKLSNVIKVFKLKHKYFSNSYIGEDYVGLPSPPTASQEATNYRLFLMELTELSGDELQAQPPYQFTYNIPTTTSFLPDRVYSKAIDHWGFYNGQTSNSTLVPQREYQIAGIPNGGNRNAQEAFTKMGVLSKITYPTGGSTLLDFQQNTAINDFIGYKNVVVPTLDYYIGSCHFGGASNTFTINDDISHAAPVTISLSGTTYGFTPINCGTGTLPVPTLNDPSTFIYLQLVNVTNPSAPVIAFTTTSGTVALPTNNIPGGSVTTTLPNGTYQIRAVRGNQYTPITLLAAGFSQLAKFSVSTAFYQLDTTSSKPVGGLRISQIQQYDKDGVTLLTTKTFNYNDELGKSTGKINFIPEYKAIKRMCYLGVDTVYYSNALSQNTFMGSTPVGYSKVTLTEIGNNNQNNGKSESFFSNPTDFVPYLADEDLYLCYTDNWIQGRTNFPFGPNVSQDWRRGLLEKRIDYNWKNNTFNPIKEVTNTYQDDFLGSYRAYRTGDAVGCRIGVTGWTYAVGGGSQCPDPSNKYYFFATQFYLYPSRIVKLIRTQEKIYPN